MTPDIPNDPGTIWDAAVEHCKQLAHTPEQGTRKALALNRAPKSLIPVHPENPEPRHLPAVARSIGQIPEELRKTIRGVVTGELPWPLFVFGPAGTGKTCAALALTDHVQGRSLYFTASDLALEVIEAQQGRLCKEEWDWQEVCARNCKEQFRRTARHEDVGEERLWRMLRGVDLLVLDELGSRNTVSDHAYECVKKAIDLRHGKPLMVVSNKTRGELALVYDDRVSSRLSAGTVLRLDGDDRRLRKGVAS